MEVVFLAWGVRLCIMVRKAPSEFNESRFISMAIYNEFLLTCFLNVSMLFLQSPANPDLLYIIFFCHTQLTITLLLALIFGSKVYIVLRSGKSHQENIGMGAKSSGAKFNFRPQVRTFANPSSVTTSTVPVAATTSAENKLSDQEALEEVRQLSMQLQRIQEMAPPKGVAVMTISSLLDGLKTPSSMVMVAAAASQGAGRNQLTVRPQKTEALPLLSLNTEMQKYQQLQVPQKTMTTTNNNVAAVKTTPTITLPSTQVTVTTSTPTKASTDTGRWEEKAVNTEIIGNCIPEEELKKRQQQQEHIICRSCYEKCKDQLHHTDTSAKLNKCQILGSPQQEGSISFKNIKLDCMCSQSDDLDQLAEPEQQTIRRITKRTAATNTPPSTTRKRAVQTTVQHSKDDKAISSVSLPSDECHSRATNKPISYVSQQQQQQQICDNCKNKFKRKESFGKATVTAAATADKKQKSQQQLQQQHRKLSRLSSKCNKLIADIENSKGTASTKSVLTNKPATKATTTHKTSTKLQPHDCDEETQYSTDDIIFYTTTDTSDSDDGDDDDGEEDEDDDDETEDDENANAIRDDDLSSSLSHSKSESRVPLKLKPHTASIELKCISLSLGNITTTSATATTASTSSTLQPESIKSQNALIEPNSTTIQVTTAAPSASSTTSSTQQQQTVTQSQQQPPPTNGSNGKAKRPDKLVLNLNDRSKFTKEVSV
ncbi:serine-rich adhesin for platelets [Lucilia sericata]|uniref:serine-rich adhesin for platelets n=1 Tax=Lucilia sericata TaxID=13632 RepID=UPI0018A88151|nr:serine-rich adhesin for platelets [Lucilia sericata]